MSKLVGAAEPSAVPAQQGKPEGEPRHENQQGKTTGSVAVFGQSVLIRDVLDNLELEHADVVLEAISQHQSEGRRTVSVPDHAVCHVRGL
ncbi:MAG: hypothetical protein ACLT8E_08290 [Akkermansia sp.]